MNYTVVWQPSAQDDLAALWVDNPSERNAITAAAAAIDAALRRDPHLPGSPVGGTRVWVRDPVVVEFTISDAQRLVTVLAIWHL